jgi:hypothetical protein
MTQNSIKKGDTVRWNWGKSTATGKVIEKSEKTIKKTIKGTDVKRNGSKEEPSYLVKQANGNEVVKSESELKPGT